MRALRAGSSPLNDPESDKSDPGTGRSGESLRTRALITGIIPVVMMGIILFGSAGRLDLPMAWIVLGVHLVATEVVTLKADPGLIEERSFGGKKPGVKGWDRRIVLLTVIFGFIALMVAGLDLRFGWSGAVPLNLQLPALAAFVLGYVLVSQATLANTFFSAVVRIQEDRGHTTVTSGPYRYIRHPGYAGLMLCVIAQPVALGSYYALIPAIITVAILLVRTGLEDRTLKKELTGYEDYAHFVRYRLLPGVW